MAGRLRVVRMEWACGRVSKMTMLLHAIHRWLPGIPRALFRHNS
jgi:hypothetical protein